MMRRIETAPWGGVMMSRNKFRKAGFWRRASRGFALATLALGLTVGGCESLRAPAGTDTAAADEPRGPAWQGTYRVDYGGRPVIGVMVNGRGPFDFVVDTAATKSAVFRNLADQLDLETSPTSTRVFSLVGVQQRPTARLDRIALAGASRSDFQVVVFEDWTDLPETPQGVLGLDVLARYVVEFDVQQRRLTLHYPSASPDFEERGWPQTAIFATDFGLSGPPLFQAPGRLASYRFPMLIDTGSELSLINPVLMDRLLTPNVVYDITARATRFADALEESTEVYRMPYAGLVTGGIGWGDGVFYATSARIFRDLEVADRMYGLLGFDILGRRSMAIDFPGRVMYASPVTPPSAAK
ncbi:MAG: hypothetical protein GC152_00410 [Alphaproteobacteria bacterium]|nr:hypothetical protein [Alphaproteobacteria bacterium]